MSDKPIIAVDLNGALMRSRPFDEAHRNWFNFYAEELNNPKVAAYGKLKDVKDWLPKVDEVMKLALGENSDKAARMQTARGLFAGLTIDAVREDDVFQDFKEYLIQLEGKYSLALITSLPSEAAVRILEKVGCRELFQFVYGTQANQTPNKKGVIKSFIEHWRKPEWYIGRGDEDIITCRQLSIKTISVNWAGNGQFRGDYEISYVNELEAILS